MFYNIVEGKTLVASQEFFEDDDVTPLVPKAGYPRVRLYDIDKNVITDTVGSVNQLQPGQYDVSIPVPKLGYSQMEQLKLVWVFRDANNDKYKVTDVVVVEPSTSKNAVDIVAIIGIDSSISFTVPLSFDDSAEVKYTIFSGNSAIDGGSGMLSDSGITIDSNGIDRTNVVMPLPVSATANMSSYTLIISVSQPSGPAKNFTYKLWVTTPSVTNAITMVEDFVNKSKVQNVIPELEYTFADMMSALAQGLNYFNGIGPQVTAFNGLNMQGALANAWFLCTCWYVLNAQILAEGSLAFDFSGQGVSLNVDRTPQLDSALGRIESQLESTVKPLKKLLVKAGITGGDGGVGANLNAAVNSRYAASRQGILTVTNSPTTQFRRGGFLGRY